MPDVIPVVVTANTKEREARFLSRFIAEQGFSSPVIDVSTRDLGQMRCDYPWDEVCLKVGISQAALAGLRRDEMMRTMGLGAGRILLDLYAENRLAGVISVGGNQGTAIAAIAMQSLPIGVPKVIISTVASGYVRPYVEYRDVMMMFSVADFVNNINVVNRTIMSNGAGAVMGMARLGIPMVKSERPVVAATAFGNTDAAVSQTREILEREDFEVVGFHASGAGGAAMEYLVEKGFIQGVLDLTTHELLAEVHNCGDIYTPLRPRLVEAGRLGIPQIISPGAMEYFCFGAADTIPATHRNRLTHYHNPYNTNVRATREEVAEAGKVMARKVNAAKGPVAVLLPTGGFSENGRIGGSLYQPETDQVLIEAIKSEIRPDIEVIEIDSNINDREFSVLAAGMMLDLMNTHEETTNDECENSKDYESHGALR